MRTPQDILSPIMKTYIKDIFVHQGRSFNICELCFSPIKKWPILHHRRYKNATIKDILIVCQKCNTQPENKYLK